MKSQEFGHFTRDLARKAKPVSGGVNHPRQTRDKYKDYLEANADYAADLAAMIADFVDYGKTKQRMERLPAKLEVPLK